MNTYRVSRRGFNTANNPSRGARPEDCTQVVATVEAASAAAAVEAALKSGVTVCNGQGIWAELESECLAAESAEAEKHAGQVLVQYWHGTTALEGWCSSEEEIDDCLDLHANSYSPRFFDADGAEVDYEAACAIVGG